MKLFIWRALRSKLPTNKKLLTICKEVVDCNCCHKPGKDDIDHIFVTRNHANYVWQKHAAVLGSHYSNTNLRSMLMQWRSLHFHNEVKKILLQIFPYFILLELVEKHVCGEIWGLKIKHTRVKYDLYRGIT